MIVMIASFAWIVLENNLIGSLSVWYMHQAEKVESKGSEENGHSGSSAMKDLKYSARF